MTSFPANLADVARDIKLSHSVFALPFALLAMFLAAGATGGALGSAGHRLPSPGEIALIIVCMVLARTLAMTMNRWADATLDAANPRTAGRAIPAGRVHPQIMLGVGIAAAFAFIIAASGFWLMRGNIWPLVLSPIVLAYLTGYSYTKRFTWLCHLYLGGALAISPLAAAIAIEPAYLARPAPWLLAALVLCWVAGFDIIYALQDVGFDLAQGLWSVPAQFGVEPALWISRSLHFFAAVAVLMLWWMSDQLQALFLAAAVAAVALLILEHILVWGSKTHRIHLAFFTVNGIISLLLGAAGIADVVLRQGLGHG